MTLTADPNEVNFYFWVFHSRPKRGLRENSKNDKSVIEKWIFDGELIFVTENYFYEKEGKFKMQQINIDELKPHPRNNEFFDDMSGEKWKEFLESIKSRGVIEPIVITPDKVIVSGHQRVRACKELGIKTVMCDVHTYNSEDEILQDLLETNIRQRGDVGGSAKKVGLRIKELERIYDIIHGNNQYGNENNSCPKTQTQLANDMGMDVRTLQNYKLLADMIPELSDLVDTGIVTKTTALAIMKNLPEDDQKEFIESISIDKKYTQKQMDEEIKKYKKRISELIQKGTKTEIITQEVDKPETLRKIKDLEEKLDKKTKENEIISSSLIEKEKMISEAIGLSTNYQLTSHCSEITLKILNFIKDMAKYDYMAESFNEIPIATRIEYEKCIKSVKKWADRILETINEEKEIIEM